MGDIEYRNLPMIGQQSINMGSDQVDFSRKIPKDHGVETKVFESVTKNKNHFSGWWNYRQNANISRKALLESGVMGQKNHSADHANGSNGVMIVLEMEDSDMLDSFDAVDS